MTTCGRPNPIWHLAGRYTTPIDLNCLQGTCGRIGPRGLQCCDASEWNQLGSVSRMTWTATGAGAPAGDKSLTSDREAIPASVMSEEVVAQASFGWGGEV